MPHDGLAHALGLLLARAPGLQEIKRKVASVCLEGQERCSEDARRCANVVQQARAVERLEEGGA